MSRKLRTPVEETFTTTISSRGQVVLPSRVRKRLGLRKGMRLRLVLESDGGNGVVLRPYEPDAIRKIRGSMPGAAEALDFLEKERKKDRERGR